jgi:hypothetical protein
MPTLSFRLKKRADSTAQLVLVREDRSFTIGDVGPPGGYGPAHDLAHYVVESTLELSEGFLGLVASGWEIPDFEIRGATALLPGEALLAECAAGQLSSEHVLGQPSTAEEFNWSMAATLGRMKRADFAPPSISEEQLAGMRALLLELHLAWCALGDGETLELTFRSGRPAGIARPSRAGSVSGPSRSG